MHSVYTPLASLWPLLLSLLLLVTHLNVATAAAAVIGVGVDAAVDKEVAPVGVVKTDLLSLEQEIGGNPAAGQAARHPRSFLFGVGGVASAWPVGYGYGYGYPGYGYYGSPYYGYGGIGGYGGYGGYYPGVFGYKKIIIG
ncbi:shematrin-like protein 1 [Drosophila mojavensis]|uniref:shematrin-like protein 1 n=1 Tax=Drosophila mojavensis TaxID=7230 RepID=UPI0013EE509E|nr:shematrin-like protein 1 [Drosophila mojavensis]